MSLGVYFHSQNLFWVRFSMWRNITSGNLPSSGKLGSFPKVAKHYHTASVSARVSQFLWWSWIVSQSGEIWIQFVWWSWPCVWTDIREPPTPTVTTVCHVVFQWSCSPRVFLARYTTLPPLQTRWTVCCAPTTKEELHNGEYWSATFFLNPQRYRYPCAEYNFLFSASLWDKVSGPRDLCSPLHPGTKACF